MGNFVEKVVINIRRLFLRIKRLNREWLLGLSFIGLLILALLCSVGISFLTVDVTSITATEDFHYTVKANDKEIKLVPGDVLRVERTQAKTMFGKNIEIIKVYTTQGFVFALPDNEYYIGVKQLAGSADFFSEATWMKDDIDLSDVRKTAYAMGTSTAHQGLVFGLLGLQNLTLIAAGVSLLLLIFPVRLEKEAESPATVARVEQLA